MKKCPYCAEEIQDEAVKCKHCGEFLNQKPKTQWYFGTGMIVVSFLCVGPLALPLIWFNPRLNKVHKTIITAAVLIGTYYLTVAFLHSMKSLTDYYKQLNSALN